MPWFSPTKSYQKKAENRSLKLLKSMLCLLAKNRFLSANYLPLLHMELIGIMVFIDQLHPKIWTKKNPETSFSSI